MNLAVDDSLLLKLTFPSLSDEEAHDLQQRSTLCHFDAGTVICAEGEDDNGVYVLLEGDVEVVIWVEPDQQLRVNVLTEGDYFGEIGPLGKTPRAATVRAINACVATRIPGDDLLRTVQNNPGLMRQIIEQISAYLRDADRTMILELRRQNEALEVARQRQLEQERFRNRFVTTLSHELRTPLTSVQGYLHLIRDGILHGDDLNHGLHAVANNVQRLVHIINHLMVLYEMEMFTPQPHMVDLRQTLLDAKREALSLTNIVDQDKVTVDLTSDLPQVCGDEYGLTLVWRLLIENGLKYSHNGNPVSVHARPLGTDMVQVEVSDLGIGIPEAFLQRIFEPFFRIEDRGMQWLVPGIGIGLPIARFLIERHQGNITVASEPGKGSTFSVSLPAFVSE